MTDYTVFRPINPVEDLIEKYEAACLAYEKAKDEKAAIAEQLASHFPDEPGEHEQVFGKKLLIVTIPEKWTWDQAVMETLFAGTKAPDYVTTKMTVTRKSYEKLPDPDQAYLRPALTRGPGSPKITIKEAKDAI